MKVDKRVSPTTNLKLVGDRRKTVCETTSNDCHIGGWDADWVAIFGTGGKGEEVRTDGLKVRRFSERYKNGAKDDTSGMKGSMQI